MRWVAVALRGRCLIPTGTGFVGLAPEEVRVGDTISVLVGCNHPIVLSPHGDVFRYVGECYFHGLMDGEAIETANYRKYKTGVILTVQAPTLGSISYLTEPADPRYLKAATPRRRMNSRRE